MKRLYTKVAIEASSYHQADAGSQERATRLIGTEMLQKIKAQLMGPEDLAIVVRQHGCIRSYTIDAELRSREEVNAAEFSTHQRIHKAYGDGEAAGYLNGQVAGEQKIADRFESMTLVQLLRWWWRNQ